MQVRGTRARSNSAPGGVASGMSMLELMIAMAVLAVGMTAVTALFHSAILTNNRAKVDTSATMLAQTVLEKIAAQPASQNAAIWLTDCGGPPHHVDDSDGGGGRARQRRHPGRQQRRH